MYVIYVNLCLGQGATVAHRHELPACQSPSAEQSFGITEFQRLTMRQSKKSNRVS